MLAPGKVVKRKLGCTIARLVQNIADNIVPTLSSFDRNKKMYESKIINVKNDRNRYFLKTIKLIYCELWKRNLYIRADEFRISNRHRFKEPSRFIGDRILADRLRNALGNWWHGSFQVVSKLRPSKCNEAKKLFNHFEQIFSIFIESHTMIDVIKIDRLFFRCFMGTVNLEVQGRG